MATTPTDSNFKHIVRIANVDLPGEKQIQFAMTKIKGIGINFADAVCISAGVKKNTKTGYLTDEEVVKLNTVMGNPAKAGIPTWMFNHRKDFETGEEKHHITGNLVFVHDNDLKSLKKIRCYRGIRHIQGQPVRGQRTKSHFRKNKGKVVGVVKKKVAPGSEEAAKGKDKEKK